MQKDQQDATPYVEGPYEIIRGAVARKPVEIDANYYNMNHPKRGLALIFSHEIFDDPSLDDRWDTDFDKDNLTKCLRSLDFEVHTYDDYKYEEIYHAVKNVSRRDHNDNDCILIAILSHGEASGRIHAKDRYYKFESIWSQFSGDRCPSLAGKPKIFLVQACQGKKKDGGLVVVADNGNESKKTSVRCETPPKDITTCGIQAYRIPARADFLFAYSTIHNHVSYRTGIDGSWFIQALCDELMENGEKIDFLSILTRVSCQVAYHHEACRPAENEIFQKQVPCVTSMLTRRILFNKKES